MRCAHPSITARLLDWVDSFEGRSPSPAIWSDDWVLRRFDCPAAAVLAVRERGRGDRVLNHLAAFGVAGGRGGRVADTAALSGLSPRLLPIVVRWRRASMPAADLADAEADLIAECLTVLRSHPNLAADVVVRSAWHRVHARRRTQRSRAARLEPLEPNTLAPGCVGGDVTADLLGRLGQALSARAISSFEATAIWAHACGFGIEEAASRAGCSVAAWRVRKCRALKAGARSGLFDPRGVA